MAALENFRYTEMGEREKTKYWNPQRRTHQIRVQHQRSLKEEAGLCLGLALLYSEPRLPTVCGKGLTPQESACASAAARPQNFLAFLPFPAGRGTQQGDLHRPCIKETKSQRGVLVRAPVRSTSLER